MKGVFIYHLFINSSMEGDFSEILANSQLWTNGERPVMDWNPID